MPLYQLDIFPVKDFVEAHETVRRLDPTGHEKMFIMEHTFQGAFWLYTVTRTETEWGNVCRLLGKAKALKFYNCTFRDLF